MCGIAYLLLKPEACDPGTAPAFETCAARIQHRGPDATRLSHADLVHEGCVYRRFAAFHRLEVNGPGGDQMQPFRDEASGVTLWCNGEIWNPDVLALLHSLEEATGYVFDGSHSDCRVLLHLYKALGFRGMIRAIDATSSVYAIVVEDASTGHTHVARDKMGVRSLYYSTRGGEVAFASEAKALQGMPGVTAHAITQFPPACQATFEWRTGGRTLAVEVAPEKPLFEGTRAQALVAVRAAFMGAVARRLHTHRPVGVFLSGGVDSTAVLGALRHLVGESVTIRSYSMAPEGSTDGPYIDMAAEAFGTVHTTFRPTQAEVVAHLPRAIYQLETWDTTTVRAGTMMYLLAHLTRFANAALPESERPVVIFTGEGSDEVNGSYMYFHDAPDDAAFDAERRRILGDIHYFDGLRVAKCTASQGFEARIPFLDRDFLDLMLRMPLAWLRPDKAAAAAEDNPFLALEKPLLREALQAFMPREIALRPKEGMSDGVSPHCETESWHLVLQRAASEALDREGIPPITDHSGAQRERQWYRMLYDRAFPCQRGAIPYTWLPRWNPAAEAAEEPSARALAVYT